MIAVKMNPTESWAHIVRSEILIDPNRTRHNTRHGHVLIAEILMNTD